MHEHVEADFLLPAHRCFVSCAQECLIVRIVERALGVSGARLAHFGRLRK